jgi:hypothetical protein
VTKPVQRLPEDEIKKVVLGLVNGQVFTAADCPPDMIASVFMVVGMGGLADYDMDTVGMVYEWLNKANELGINGYPTFVSCRVVHTEDWKAITERAAKVAEAMKEALQ